MKISTSKICINPLKAYPSAGFINAPKDITQVFGDLYLRYLSFEEDDTLVVLLSLDSIGVSSKSRKKFYEVLKKEIGKDFHLIVSATHTHFAPSCVDHFDHENLEYVDFVCEKLKTAYYIRDTKGGDFTISYRYKKGNGIGKSRLTNQPSEEIYVQSLNIEHQGHDFINIIMTNCHPTIMAEDSNFFSCEYPGFVLANLENNRSHINYYFLQGCAGDVSTRFTRKEKTVAEEFRLCQIFENEVNIVNSKDSESFPLTMSYKEVLLPFNPVVKEIDIESLATSGLSEKEIKEFSTAKHMLKSIKADLEKMDKEIIVSALRLGPYRLVFNSFELYSAYNTIIDIEKDFLVCYSQGSQMYLSFLDNKEISYETLIEVADEDFKKLLIETIQNI